MSPTISKKLGVLSLLLLGLAQSGFADSVILKSGEEVKGDIIRRDSNSLVVEYYVTATIKDQKTYSYNDITKITTVPDDEKAYLALGSLTAPPSVLDSSYYDPLLDKKIPDFFKQYAYSKHMPELRKAVRSLSAERDRVNKGDRRIDGEWITAAQVAADPYDMGARIQYNEVKKLAAEDDPVATLKAYEILEKKYPGSSVMPDAIELIKPQLDQLQAKLTAIKTDFDVLAKKRQDWLASATADQVKELNASLANEALKSKADIAAAVKDGSKFFPLYPNIKEALDQLQVIILAENARLKLLPVPAMRESIGDTSSASKLINNGSITEAQTKLTSATSLWPLNAQVAILKQRIEDAAKAKAKASPTP